MGGTARAAARRVFVQRVHRVFSSQGPPHLGVLGRFPIGSGSSSMRHFTACASISLSRRALPHQGVSGRFPITTSRIRHTVTDRKRRKKKKKKSSLYNPLLKKKKKKKKK